MSPSASAAGRIVSTVNDEQRFQMLIDAVVDYAMYMITPDGFVASWNSGDARIKGYSAEEIIGEHFSRFHTEADRAAGKPAQTRRFLDQRGARLSVGGHREQDADLGSSCRRARPCQQGAGDDAWNERDTHAAMVVQAAGSALGRGLIMPEPEAGGGQSHGCQEVAGELVVAGG
ncbi:MAG: PAS domain S-box protein, partial [Alphaproteobacteria bacterium]|nr:PAS domain S-box protein [Alphaproteobacteria bacterium]